MEKYKIHKPLGDGAFGTVSKAVNIKTNEVVAIKKMKRKFTSWDECKQLREIKSLMKLSHPNIVKLNEVLRVNDELHLVFEFLEENLYQCYNKQKETKEMRLSEKQIKSVIYKAAEALAYMHKHGFFHRDMKPENILVHREEVKLADFGLAREIRSRPPFTDYVSTRWYRAPEILLKATNYNSPIDIFALGCIMAELYLGSPLFAGNSEFDQIYKICSVLGTPSSTSWPEGYRLASQIGFSFPQMTGIGIAQVIKDAPPEAVNLITEMLRFDPSKRPTAQQVLQHPYFAGFSPSKILINDVEPLPTAIVSTGNDNKIIGGSPQTTTTKNEKDPISTNDPFGLPNDNLELDLDSFLKNETKQGGLGVELRLPGSNIGGGSTSNYSDPFKNDIKFDTKADSKKYDLGGNGITNQPTLTQRNRKSQIDYASLEDNDAYDFKLPSSYNDGATGGTKLTGGEYNNSQLNTNMSSNYLNSQRSNYNFSTKEALGNNFQSDNFKPKTNDIYDFSNVLMKKDKPISENGLEEKPYQPSMFGNSTNVTSTTNVQAGYGGDFGGNYGSKAFLSGATNRSALGGNKFGGNYSGNTGGTYSTGYQAKPYGSTLQTNASSRNFPGVSATGGMDGGSYNGNYDLYKF